MRETVCSPTAAAVEAAPATGYRLMAIAREYGKVG